MTDPVPANAIGLPAPTSATFDRRNFLATLAAAGVLTASLVDPLAAEALTDAEHPDATLLKHVAQHVEHKALQQAYDAAADEACERYVSPPIPEALWWRKSDFLSVCFDLRHLTTYKIDGVERHVYEERRGLRDLLNLRKGWDRESGFDHHAHSIARAEEILAAIDTREADIQRAEDEAGITEPTLAAKHEEDILTGLRRAIALTPARTLEGLAAKAMVARDLCTWDSKNPEAVRNMLAMVVDRADRADWREAVGMSLAIDAADVLTPSSERSAA